jgi:hypothetical protein
MEDPQEVTIETEISILFERGSRRSSSGTPARFAGRQLGRLLAHPGHFTLLGPRFPFACGKSTISDFPTSEVASPDRMPTG